MARHRHIKNMDYDEEYYEAYDDTVYGHSYDETESYLSSSMEGYMYKKDENSLSHYMANANIQEEDELDDDDDQHARDRRDSLNFERPRLSSENEARLNSVLDSLRDVVGETFSDSTMVKTILANNYDHEASLDALFKLDERPKEIARPAKQQKKAPQKKKTENGKCVERINATQIVKNRVNEVLKNHKPKRVIDDSLKNYELQLLENNKKKKLPENVYSLKVNFDSKLPDSKISESTKVSKSIEKDSLASLAEQHMNKVGSLNVGSVVIPPLKTDSGSITSKNSSLFALAQTHFAKVGSSPEGMPLPNFLGKLPDRLQSMKFNKTLPMGVSTTNVNSTIPTITPGFSPSLSSVGSPTTNVNKTVPMGIPNAQGFSSNIPSFGSSGSSNVGHICEKAENSEPVDMPEDSDIIDLSVALTKNFKLHENVIEPSDDLTVTNSCDTFDAVTLSIIADDDEPRLELLNLTPQSTFGKTVNLIEPVKKTPIVIDAPYVPAFRPKQRDKEVTSVTKPIEDKDDNNETPDKQKGIVLPVAKLRDRPVDIELKYRETKASGTKPSLNLVIVGHVDSGKSTIMGHILYLKGIVNKRAMHKFEKESKEMKRQSFLYAWVLDETMEERSRGVTVDIAQKSFETEHKAITLLDAPGHKDFIPNMITGASRADVAVLVIDAQRGRFESGFEHGGQTREHAILIRSLGVSQLAVAVNKMDTVEWSSERFYEIQETLKRFLKTLGYKDREVTYVPCSGLTGDNLCEDPNIAELNSWYQGGTLLDAIDKLEPPEREILRPIRFCISNVTKASGSNVWVTGRLQTGYIQTGDKLLLLPHPEIGTVKRIETDTGNSGFGFAGDSMDLTISGVDPLIVHIGDFFSDPEKPVKLANIIRARIVVCELKVPIIKGTSLDFHMLSLAETAIIRNLVYIINKSTGEITNKHPRVLVSNVSAVVDIEFPRPLCMELFKEFKDLGRFSLRKACNTIAVGMVTEILS